MTSRWLFSPAVDVAAFAGSAVLSVALALAAPALGLPDETPPWAWLLLVVGLDVAHVWSTLYRAYLDPAELHRRPMLYAGAPFLAWALGVAAHAVSPEFFWTVLAYVAVWHFIRQQVGWMTLYGRRAKDPERQVRFDRAVTWAVTLGPVLWWHANLPRPFWWFREGDFVAGLPPWAGGAALVLHFAVLAAWLTHALATRSLHPGKSLLLAATWLAWFGGIVLARGDFGFTVTNVVLHAVPYLVLLYRYARHRAAEPGGDYGLGTRVLRAGLPGFLAVLLVLAFLEEFAWDRLVWHDHPQFFGAGALEVDGGWLTLLVPLLALPQTTHYLLDGYVWRTRDDPRLAERLGWAPPAAAS